MIIWPLCALNTTGHGGERGGGIATRGGERQRKLLAPNTATGPSARAVDRGAGGALRAVDTHALDVAAPQQRSEQPHLAAGSGAFAAQPRRRQGGFHGEGEKASSNASNSLGNGVEKVRALFRAELRIGCKGRGGGFCGGGGSPPWARGSGSRSADRRRHAG